MTDAPARRDLPLLRDWQRSGTAAVLDALGRITDSELRGPSLLPGWSRAAVTGHLSRNAEALSRLAAWARTGIETPMYANTEQRNAEIAAAALQPPAQLRAEFAGSAGLLEAALDRLDGPAWQRTVRTAQARSVPASEIPWLRVRELWLHLLDLDAPPGPAGPALGLLPADLVDALLAEVLAGLAARDGCPAAVLAPTDRDDSRRLPGGAPPAGGPVPVVRGTAADLLGWASGRTHGAGVGADGAILPVLPAWL